MAMAMAMMMATMMAMMETTMTLLLLPMLLVVVCVFVFVVVVLVVVLCSCCCCVVVRASSLTIGMIDHQQGGDVTIYHNDPFQSWQHLHMRQVARALCSDLRRCLDHCLDLQILLSALLCIKLDTN